MSKDLPKAGESFQASPAKTPLGSPWRVAETDLGPAAAPLLRVIQNQQRGHMPVPGACSDGCASFLLVHSTLVRAQTLWCSHHSGDLAVSFHKQLYVSLE